MVVGRYGEADLRSETELDEQDVADYAASSIRDLLQQISPLIDGTEDQPILLVNGKRIADPRDIRGYPPEALQRVEILPREAAAHYGYAPERRVVNLVLKKQFSGLTGEASLSLPTAGGRDSETLQVQRVAIDGDKRWNVEASVGRESLLLDSARDVPVPPGTGSIAGNVLAIGAGELDPRPFAIDGPVGHASGCAARRSRPSARAVGFHRWSGNTESGRRRPVPYSFARHGFGILQHRLQSSARGGEPFAQPARDEAEQPAIAWPGAGKSSIAGGLAFLALFAGRDTRAVACGNRAAQGDE